MRNYISYILTLALLCGSLSLQAQTQEEIEQMLNGNTQTTEKVKKEKVEKVKKEKEKTEKEAEEVVEETKEELESTTNETKEKVKKEKEEKEAKVKNTGEETAKKVKESKKVADDETENSTNLSTVKTKKLIKIGDALAEDGSNYNAQDYYEAALMNTSKKKKQLYLYNQLGESNFMMRDYKLARKYLERTVQLDTKGKYNTASYQLANTYKHQANYDTAMVMYRKFLSDNEKDTKLDFEKARARLEIKGCKYADTLSVDIPAFELENAGENINGPFSDYGPEMKNGALYHSKINSQVAVSLTGDEMTEDQYSRIYKDGEKVEEDYNGGRTFNGNPSFSADGNTMYFTICELVNGTQSRCDIYISQYENGDWQPAQKLNNNINAAGTSTTQPQITTDVEGNEVLYFVATERDRGRGGKDIWYAHKNDDGTFDNAKNLGYPLNTRYDDMSPFYHESTQTLYFSSNGHTSIGGFDIFSSQMDEDGDWTDPANMETPLNSSLDDYDFVLSPDGTLGYLASNRVGTTTLKSETCCDDIFKVTAAENTLHIAGLVYEDNTKRISELSQIKLTDADTDEVIAETDFTGEEFVFQLEPDMNYTLTVSNINFEDESIDVNTSEMYKSDTLFQDFLLTKRKEIQKKYVLSTIYYEFNMSKLRADAPDSLAKVLTYMEANPMAVIEVGAHTDNKGTPKYNENLSEKRSEAAYNFLLNQGIPKERLEQEWYSETQPAAPNTNEDGSDNPEGRALNRRTEFKVIRQLTE